MNPKPATGRLQMITMKRTMSGSKGGPVEVIVKYHPSVSDEAFDDLVTQAVAALRADFRRVRSAANERRDIAQ